ncbi:hypothetical protein [Streptomyces lydicus]|uniref:hypothetical protein n=1 Tax=Streptomyces lydicus TaxID=47763 RepID=UPI0036E6133E
MIEGLTPGGTCLLDLATLELHLGTSHQIEGDDPRIGARRSSSGGAGVLLGRSPMVTERFVDLRRS